MAAMIQRCALVAISVIALLVRPSASVCSVPQATLLIPANAYAFPSPLSAVSLKWSVVEAVGCTLSHQVAATSPAGIVITSPWITTTGYALDISGIPGGTWEWTVYTRDAVTTSVASDSWTFCIPYPPTIPTLSSPLNGETFTANEGQIIGVTLQWMAVTWGYSCTTADNTYIVDVSLDGGITYSPSFVSGTSTQLALSLPNAYEVRWRVSATNGQLSKNSSTGWFSTCIRTPPGIPVASSPSNTVVKIDSVTFAWGTNTDWGTTCGAPQTNTVSLTYWRDTETPATISVTGQYTYVTTNLVVGSYQWYIEVSNGVLSKRSVTRSFTACASSGPTAPKLTAPDKDVLTTADTVQFSWEGPSSWGDTCGDIPMNTLVLELLPVGGTKEITNVTGLARFNISRMNVGNYTWLVVAANQFGVAASGSLSFSVVAAPILSSSEDGHVSSSRFELERSSEVHATSTSVVIQFDPTDVNGVTTNELANEIATAIGVPVSLVTVTFVNNGEVLVTISGANAIAKADELVRVIKEGDAQGIILRKAVDAYIRSGSNLMPTSAAPSVSIALASILTFALCALS